MSFRRFVTARRALSALFLLASGSLNAQTTVLGTTAGQFQVDAAGAADYTIPITVPPGIGGIRPQIAISYSSRAANGSMGLGFSLSGVSQISRCPATLDGDGGITAINFSSTDRFCLNGQRLMAVTGAYGATGTEYRTEMESFTKIVSYGGTAGDPAYFRAWSKDGMVTEFGNSADSRIEAIGRTQAFTWAQNRIANTVGMAMTVAYSENAVTGETVPVRMDYAISAGTPYARVTFDYTLRNDTAVSYRAGSKVTQALRLGSITTYANANFTSFVRRYSYSYDYGGNNATSRLLTVTECTPSECLPATNFTWKSKPTNGFASSTATVTNIWGLSDYTWSGDFNGDGRADIASANGANVYMKLANAMGGFDSQTWPVANNWGQAAWTRIGDFNGDGKMDIASPQGSAVYMKLSTGSGFVSQTWAVSNTWSVGSAGTWAADFDGDGRADLAAANAGNVYVKLSTGSGFTSLTWPVANLWETGTGEWTRIGDFNGDGRADIASPNAANIYMKLSTGNGFTSQTWPVANNWSVAAAGTFTGDFNGDGQTDIAAANGANVYIKLSTGNSFLSQTWPVAALWEPGSGEWTRVGDFNNDGLTDIASPNAGNVYMKLSTGSGFDSQTWPVVNAWSPLPQNVGAEDFNGDGVTDIVAGNGPYIYLKTAVSGPDLVAKITNGLGAIVEIDYKRLTDSSVYTKGTSAVYPDQDVQAPLSVVSEQRTTDGAGGLRRVVYEYSEARLQLRGRGSQGFAKRVATDLATGVREETRFHQYFPMSGLPYYTDSSVTGQSFSRKNIAYQTKALPGGRYFPFSGILAVDAFEHGTGVLITRTVTSSFYDEPASVFHGNLSRRTVQIDRGGVGVTTHQTSITNTYQDDEALWYLGRLIRTTATHEASGTVITRTSAFEYDPATGLLTAEIIEPDDTTGKLKLRTEYTREVNGLIRYTRVKGALGLPDRVTRRDYDSLKQFEIGFVNPLNHQSSQISERKGGTVQSATDFNGLVTSWTYDTFGRITGETRSDGTSTTLARVSCNGAVPACGSGGVVRTDITNSDGSRSWSDIDALEREVSGGRAGFDGTAVVWSKSYNNRGELAYESVPHFVNDPTYHVTYTYDSVGRVKSWSLPKNQNGGTLTTNIAYNGFSTTQTDPLNRTTTRVVDETGALVSVTDPVNGTTTYAHDPIGNLLTTADPAGNQIINTYNVRGQKLTTQDPDLGLWTYGYNHFGELLTQIDAKGQVQTLTYDPLGRVATRSEPEGTTTWTWDTAWKGALSNVIAPGGYQRVHTYDTQGRGKTTTTVINGISSVFVADYDSQGRVSTLTYPQGLAVAYTYNSRGYVNRLSDATTSALYWQGDAQDALGNWTLTSTGNGVSSLSSYDQANGYIQTILSSASGGPIGDVQSLNFTWDDAGNLSRRTDQRQGGQYEEFTYDALDRVTRTHLAPVSGPAVPDVTISYDALGNVRSKSDVGTYTYTGAKPHAVSGFNTGPRGTTTFAYDANGNQLSGFGRTLSWTSFNLPKTITLSGSSATYDYGPDREKIYQQSVQPATDTTSADTVMYVGDGLFERHLEGSTVTWRNTLIVDGQSIGLVIQSGPSGATRTTRYLHADHLDSVSAVTGPTGSVLERLSYDVFGKRRTFDWRPDSTDALLKVGHETDAGYTSHEHIDHVSLIHMRGRVYDPVVGRFTSADPYIQFPDNSQSFNRYSYVLNNPLTYTDPSGFGLKGTLKKGVKTVKRTVKKAVKSVQKGLSEVAEYFADNPHLATMIGSAVACSASEGVYFSACISAVATSVETVQYYMDSPGEGRGFEPSPPRPAVGIITLGNALAFSTMRSGPEEDNEGRNPAFEGAIETESYEYTGGIIYDDDGNIIGEIGLETSSPEMVVIGGIGALKIIYAGLRLAIAEDAVLASRGVHRALSSSATTKVPRAGLSGKEAAKDVPSWVRGQRPLLGEKGKDFATRTLDGKYGPGNYPKGPRSEFNKIQKWADRAFVDP